VATASERSIAPVPPFSVGTRSVVGGRPASWVAGSPRWPAWPAGATGAALVSVEGVGDLLDVNIGFDEGLSAKALTVGIGLFVASAGVFLLNVQHARDSPLWVASLRATPAQAAQWWAVGGIFFLRN
jgi:hypothetical protein